MSHSREDVKNDFYVMEANWKEFFLSESATKWGWELEKEEEGEEEGWSKSTWFKGPYILLSLVKL